MLERTIVTKPFCVHIHVVSYMLQCIWNTTRCWVQSSNQWYIDVVHVSKFLFILLLGTSLTFVPCLKLLNWEVNFCYLLT